MSDKCLWFTKDGTDLAEGVELRNGKSNPFGWSTHEVWHSRDAPYPGAVDEEKIADLYCGEPINVAPGYGFRFEEAPDRAD